MAKHIQESIGVECYNNQNAYPIFEPAPLNGLPAAFAPIICRDDAFVKTLKIAARVAMTEASVFISGDSGVGKELIAEAIHNHGKGEKLPLVKINCAAIPDTLFESELFGYEKGAFTGATSNGKKGKIEMANGGTLFLDEIGELPMNMQVKLLRVLQEKELERVGGTQTFKVDFRLVTATNRDLEQMVARGEFREDLYYRLNVIRLDVPPLCERRADIADLTRLFLCKLKEKYGYAIGINADALACLQQYAWPGNVRELKNTIEQSYILCTGGNISVQDLPEKMRAKKLECVEQTGPDCYNLNELVAQVERETIQAVMSLTGNNKTRAIEMLGISRRCFYQKLEKYQIA